MENIQNDLSFEKFRKRLGDFAFDACQWVSATGLYCYGTRQPGDMNDIVSFFTRHPNVKKIQNFEEDLCDVAFCKLHSAAAKLLRYKDSGLDPTAVVRIDRNSVMQWKSPIQWVHFGGNDTMHLAMGEQKNRREHTVVKNEETRTVSLKFKKDKETSDQPDTKSEGTDSISEVPEREIRSHSHDNTTDSWLSDEDNEEPDDQTEDRAADGDAAKDTDKENNDTRSDRGRERRAAAIDGHPSPRAEKSRRTKVRDDIHKASVAEAEEIVVDLMEKDIKVRYATPGYVYALRDREIGLIKFGCTGTLVTTRLGKIQSDCHVGQPLEIVAGERMDPGNASCEPILAYEVLEKLVHAYLQPYRWYFNCEHKNIKKNIKKDVRHREYFDINDEDARSVFRLWRAFMIKEPFASPTASPKLWFLKGEWLERIRSRTLPARTAEHKAIFMKLNRWAGLLEVSHRNIGDGNLFGHPTPPYFTTIESQEGRLGVQAEASMQTHSAPSTPGRRPKERSQVPVAKRSYLLDSSGHRIIINLPPSPDTLPPQPNIFSAAGTSQMRPIHGKDNAESSAKDIDLNPAVAEASQEGLLGVAREAPMQTSSAPSTPSGKTSSKCKNPVRKKAWPDFDSAGRVTTPPLRWNFGDASTRAAPTEPFIFTAPTRSANSPLLGMGYEPPSTNTADADAPALEGTQKDQPSGESLTAAAKVPDLAPNLEGGIDWMAKYRELESAVYLHREGLPERTILGDLIQFRWLVAFTICLGTYSSQVPSTMALFLWTIFVPFLLADLRSWFPQLDLQIPSLVQT